MLITAGKTVKEVTKELGITRETLAQWKRQPAFEALLNQLRREFLEQSIEVIRASVVEATRQLVKLTQTADSDEVRRKACNDILELAGFRNGHCGVSASDIGPTDEVEVAKKQLHDAKEKKFMEGLNPFH